MFSKIFRKNEKGFTLIEILLISVIVLLIGVSIILPFRGGKNTWKSADKDSETIQNAVIGMEKVVREIKNSPGLTDFSPTAIRFAVLRQDTTDIDGDGNTTEYVSKYAMVKRSGDYLKYGERDTDSSSEGDWTLSNLAYPVTNLSFAFKKGDGSDAVPGTDPPEDVKSILINLTTSEGGVTIPLTSRAYLVMGAAQAAAENFTDVPEDPNVPDLPTPPYPPGLDEEQFNEPAVETSTTPPAGSLGDGVKGWSLADYVAFGDEDVLISNNTTVNGNVGTRSESGNAFVGQNSSEINGYLVVKGSLKMENVGTVNNGSVLAACKTGSSSNFKNSAQVNGNFWTLNNITLANTSKINGTVYIPADRSVTAGHFTTRSTIDAEPRTFMKDPKDYPEVAWADSAYPKMPDAETFPAGFFPVNSTTTDIKKETKTLNLQKYGNVDISNGSIVTLAPVGGVMYFNNLSVSNSSQLIIPSGDYYFSSIDISNSSKLSFQFNGAPIRIYINNKVPKNGGGFKDYSFELSNSSSFSYTGGGADLLYVEAQQGFNCANSVQWKGFVYSPNGNVVFSNSSSLTGAAYSKKKVDISNHVTVTYMPPLNMGGIKLLKDKFYPEN
jgi:type II secretory pathway pseudopilin PulG